MYCNVLLHSCTVPHCNRRSARVWLCCTNIILPAQHSTEPYRTTPLYYWALLKCTALYCTVLGRSNGTTAAATQTSPVWQTWAIVLLGCDSVLYYVRYYTVLCCTVLHFIVRYCTVLYCIVLYGKVLCCAVLCSTTVLNFTARHRAVCSVLCCTVLYLTVRYCTVLYCIALYCTVLYCTVLLVLYCTVRYCTVLYGAVLLCTMPYCSCTVFYCTVLYCAILCCTAPDCTALHCTILYCTVLEQPTLHVPSNPNNLWLPVLRIPFQLASSPGRHITYIPSGNLVPGRA